MRILFKYNKSKRTGNKKKGNNASAVLAIDLVFD
jgi:hypothetical protein